MRTIKTRFLGLFSSVGAFFGSCSGACGIACAASGCCGSYALFGFIGLSGSGLQFLQKLTPFFLVLTIFSLAFAFYKAYQPQPKKTECCDTDHNESGQACCSPPKKANFFQSRSFLWAVTILSAILWTYPLFSKSQDSEACCDPGVEMMEETAEGNATAKACCPESTKCAATCVTDDKAEK